MTKKSEIPAAPFDIEGVAPTVPEVPEHIPEDTLLVRLLRVCDMVYAKYGQDEYGQDRRNPLMVKFKAEIDEMKRELYGVVR